MVETPKFYLSYDKKGQFGHEVLMRDVSIEYTERPTKLYMGEEVLRQYLKNIGINY